MSRTALAAVLALLIAVPAGAAKPQPPPTPPKIVAIVPGNLFRAIASDGAVYEVGIDVQTAGDPCTYAISQATLLGRLFMAPPVSPITSALETGVGLWVTLENGDVWTFPEFNVCRWTGHYGGNIFSSSTGARLTDFPVPSFAPPVTGDAAASEDDTPATVRPGAVK